MSDVYPTVLLKNEATGRFHPMIYRWSPLPSGALSPGVERYKSMGHHTEGFGSREEAMKYIEDGKARGFVWTGREGTWDGKDIPASVDFFTEAELKQ